MADMMTAIAPDAAAASERACAVESSRHESSGRPKFDKDDGFLTELRHRVEVFFRTTGRKERDCWQMYLKTVIIFAWLAACYALLMFVASAWWQALLVAIPLALAMAAIGFNVQHDGAHHGYSRHAWVNKLMSMSIDLIGVSSYFWHWKHNIFHHTYVNIEGHDTDIDVTPFARMSPHQKRLGFHRWQHFYMWFLYGLMTVRWQLIGDFRDWVTGKVGDQRVPRPKGWDLVIFLGGKAVFALGLALPLLVHPFWVVALFYLTASLVVGVVMSLVFQLAHCVAQADFPAPQESGRMAKSWAVHQVETTVDYARGSGLVSWFLGGLNFQIEHHLFPHICHVNYRAITKLVEETCREFGVRFTEHKTVRAGLVSHYRWLRHMATTG